MGSLGPICPEGGELSSRLGMLTSACCPSQNYCVLAKLRDFVASPQCWRVARVDALKDKVRKLYTIMNSFCRRVRMPLASPLCWLPGRTC